MSYVSKKCIYDGYKFDSETERDFYIKLKIAKDENVIKDFEMQVPIRVQEEFINFRGSKEQKIEYVADFVIISNDDNKVVVDVKGSKTSTEEVSRIKQKMYMYNNEGCPIYFVAPLPKFLGNIWVDVSKGSDFSGKLRKRYVDLNGKWAYGKPNWTPKDWTEHFEFEDFHGLFYIWHKTKTVKKKKV